MTIEEEIAALDEPTKRVCEVARELVLRGYSPATVRTVLFARRRAYTLREYKDILAINRGFIDNSDYARCLRMRCLGKVKNRKEYFRRRQEEQLGNAELIAPELLDEIAFKERDEENLRVHLNGALSALSESERDLIMKRYFEKKTLREIAEEENVTEQAISRREQRILGKMRVYIRKTELT